MAAERLNRILGPRPGGPTWYTALVHTEGCGVAFASTREIYAHTMVGCATHPLVRACLFLEHGCEKAHNDYLRSLVQAATLPPESFGWASVQLDGGIAPVLEKITGFFAGPAPPRSKAPTERPPALALLVDKAPPAPLAQSLALVARQMLAAGGSVVLPATGPLHKAATFWSTLGLAPTTEPTLAYGQAVQEPGLHLMESPTPHWTETLTGLAATGVHGVLAFSAGPRPGHPFVPVVFLAVEQGAPFPDLILSGESGAWPGSILERVSQAFEEAPRPRSLAEGHFDFQLTRGFLGVST